MNFNKFISFLTILIMSGFVLTACKNETAYIHDQRGKSIPVSTTDSDTYTFKLPTATKIETPSVEFPEETIPEEPEVPTESKEPIAEPEIIPEEPPVTIGPKTGEP